MDKINAVILAGDRKASLLINNDNKAFLKVNNVPCIIYTLKSFLNARHIGNIIIVGPKKRLEKTLYQYNLLPDKRIKIIEQQNSLIENGEAGYIASLEMPGIDINISSKAKDTETEKRSNYSSEDKKIENQHMYEKLKNIDIKKFAEIPVLVSSCDIPVIIPGEIDEFILKADLKKYDYIIGLCSEESLKDYYPTETEPGMRLNYFHLKEGNFRVNNMNIIKPLKIERLEYIERMYEVRYQKKMFNMLKLLIRIIFNGRGIMIAFFKALKLHMALYCFDRGYEKFYPRFKESVRIDKVFKSIGKILGTRASYIVTSLGGTALDIDHPEDRDVIEKMQDKWIKHQEDIKNKKTLF